MSPKTLRIAAEAGVVEGSTLSDGPWLFRRSQFATPRAEQVAEHAKLNPQAVSRPEEPLQNNDIATAS